MLWAGEKGEWLLLWANDSQCCCWTGKLLLSVIHCDPIHVMEFFWLMMLRNYRLQNASRILSDYSASWTLFTRCRKTNLTPWTWWYHRCSSTLATTVDEKEPLDFNRTFQNLSATFDPFHPHKWPPTTPSPKPKQPWNDDLATNKQQLTATLWNVCAMRQSWIWCYVPWIWATGHCSLTQQHRPHSERHLLWFMAIPRSPVEVL